MPVGRRASRGPLLSGPGSGVLSVHLVERVVPGPFGATAARDASASAAVAPFFASQRQPWAAR